MIREHEVIHIHTPLLEAPLVGALSRLARRPLLMTHQGDLVMPPGLVDQTVEKVGTLLLDTAARLATVVSPLNEDYAAESRFLARFADKLVPILPPVEIPKPPDGAAARWRGDLGLDGKRLVGFAGRWVEEKGFDYLLRGAAAARRGTRRASGLRGRARDDLRGFHGAAGRCWTRTREHVTFVGLLRDRRQLANFYAMCDVFALPSRTESWRGAGRGDAERAPACHERYSRGARCVPETGMGRLVAPHDPRALAEGLAEVLDDAARNTRPRDEIAAIFDPDASWIATRS